MLIALVFVWRWIFESENPIVDRSVRRHAARRTCFAKTLAGAVFGVNCSARLEKDALGFGFNAERRGARKLRDFPGSLGHSSTHAAAFPDYRTESRYLIAPHIICCSSFGTALNTKGVSIFVPKLMGLVVDLAKVFLKIMLRRLELKNNYCSNAYRSLLSFYF